MRVSPRQRCPCHSGRTFGACCLPVHRGDVDPAPDALMRARYAAYATGKVRFLQDTAAVPPADRARWATEIEAFCAAVSFDALRVGPVETDASDPGVAWVTFCAGLSARGADVGFTERSRFVRRERWLYADGERLEG